MNETNLNKINLSETNLNEENLNELIVITGPTACGKTATAIKLAKQINGEIISADSKQIYRGMDIGTAKPSLQEQEGIPHHLLDIVEPNEYFSAKMFQTKAAEVIDDIIKRGKTPIMAGGTGFYIKAAIYLNALDYAPGEVLKPRYKAEIFILQRERAQLYEAINQRVDEMLEKGLADEVSALLAAGIPADSLAMQALGYKQMLPYLKGLCSLQDAANAIKQGSRRYAKRQLTWFRHQMNGHYIDMENLTSEDAAGKIRK